jgi:hypothetical protein
MNMIQGTLPAGVTRTAGLAVDPEGAPEPPPPPGDAVTITRAEYRADRQELHVRAESSASGATLTVYVTVTDAFIGTLDSGGRGDFFWPTNPQSITVRSNLGGSATASVDLN